MSEESSSIKGLPSETGIDKFPELGIEEITLSPNNLYFYLRDIPEDKRSDYKMVFACTGGTERSRIMGNVANEMGFDVARILNPSGYHKKYGVPIDELLEPSTKAEFPKGSVKFSDYLDKAVNYVVVFTNDISDQQGTVKDAYTDRMLNAISFGLSKASEASGQKPEKVTLIRVPATEMQVHQAERLFKADN